MCLSHMSDMPEGPTDLCPGLLPFTLAPSVTQEHQQAGL